MLKAKPERMTYAQEKLIKLIEERKLRKWCMDNGFTHSAVYRLALGEQIPTYKIIASMCHLISPVEWLFYTDEKLPYEPVLIPQWDCKNPSKYVKAHRYDYKTIAEKYSLEELNAYNIFVAYRSNPTPTFIRTACDATDPTEFFTDGEGEIKSLKEFTPDRGDIVSVDGKIILVITKKEPNEKNKSFAGCLVVQDSESGIELSGNAAKGKVLPHKLASFEIAHTMPRMLIEKETAEFTASVIEEVRKGLD